MAAGGNDHGLASVRHEPPRTFKHRRGRITAGQRAALDALWPRYGLDAGPGPIDPATVFGRHAPVVVEIGFGMGETTLTLAAADPERDVIAIDVHTPGAGALLRDLDAGGLTNVRVMVADAQWVLRELLSPGSLQEIRVFFPDPWPKGRHHKRRLFSAPFVALAASRLRPGGRLHSATDWADYATQMLRLVEAEPLLHNSFGGPAPRPAWRPVTRFEQQGLDKGHEIVDVIAERISVG